MNTSCLTHEEPPPLRCAVSIPWLAWILCAALSAGCASQNVNPPKPKAKTGYVDLFNSETNAISWAIQDAPSNKSVYTKYEPQTGIVRLALSPGNHRLSIDVLNKMTGEPVMIQVSVVDARIVPVRIRLVESGNTRLFRQTGPAGGTYYGRYGRRPNISRDETQTFQIKAEILDPVPYAPKETVTYAH